MSEDDALFGYRLRVLDYAGRTSVSEACRVFGIHRSTFYVWKRRAERHGLEILRPRERRQPRVPNQLSPFVGERVVALALGHPGLRARRGGRAPGAPGRGGGERAWPRALGRHRRLRERCLALPTSAWPQHAGEAAGACRRLRGAVRAAARARAGAARRGAAPGRGSSASIASSSAASLAP